MERGQWAREEHRLELVGQGVVWSVVSGESGGLVEEQEEDSLSVHAADAQERADALHAELMARCPATRVREVLVPHEPQAVVYGFDVHQDAVSTRADRQADAYGLH